MSSERPDLSLIEWLDLGVVMIQTALTVILTLFTAPFRGEKGNRDFSKHVTYAASKSYNARASARQLQSLNPSTTEAYIALAKTKQFQPVSTALPYGAKAHWIGSEKASKTLVFFHGGGYVKPATTHFKLLWDLSSTFGPDLSICLLSYSLAPKAQYPVQLQQAVGLLKHLIVDTGKKPESIILVGDSAGGNLVLGLLAHLLHRHPSIESLDLPQPLRGAALISPWGDFSTSSASFARNKYKDSIDASVLEKWASYFMGDNEVDEYNQPFRASTSRWKGLETKVQNVLITAGADEVCVDVIEEFTSRIEESLPGTSVIIGQGEVHDQPFLGEENEGKQAEVFKAWLKARM